MGDFLWEAGSNLVPGQYFYKLQLVGGSGVIFQSDTFNVVCATCPVTSSAAQTFTGGASSATSGSPTSFATGFTSSITNGGSGSQATAATSSAPAPSHSGLSAGAAAGIGVAGAVIVLGVIALIVWLCLRSRKRRNAASQVQHDPPELPHSPAPLYTQQEMKYNPSDLGIGQSTSSNPSHHQKQLSHELDGSALAGLERNAYHSNNNQSPSSNNITRTGSPSHTQTSGGIYSAQDSPRLEQPAPSRSPPPIGFHPSPQHSPQPSYGELDTPNLMAHWSGHWDSPESQQGLFIRPEPGRERRPGGQGGFHDGT